MSRVNNSIKNILASTGSQLVSIALSFILRTVFIHTLGAKYLGISGLFSNILAMLSLVDLGIGVAITYNLYKPIATKDEERIAVLMRLYRNAYRFAGSVIALLGLLMIPFLPLVIKDDLSFINVNLIYVIYLTQSVSSYLFFAYKSTIIRANQKEYIITVISSIFSILLSLAQIILLLVFGNFTLYVFTSVFFIIVQNIFIAIKADKMFPFIKGPSKDKLQNPERKKIIKDCFAISIYKINGFVVNATDNIVLSTFIGLEIVGKYSNYLLIITTIKALLHKFYNAIQAGLGDLHASEDPEHEYFIFKVINFFTICSFGIASVGLFIVGNSFIDVWIGNDYVLSDWFILLLSFELYIFGIQKTLASFRTAMGLFQQAKYRPLFGAVINLGLSVLLVQYLGISGVLIGTIASSILTYMWFDPYIIYKHGFQKPVRGYYFKNLQYLLVLICSGGISYLLTSLIKLDGIVLVIISGGISVLVTVGAILLCYYKSPEFKYLLRLFNDMIRKVRKIFT